jgi:hypothetical protein
MSGGAPFAAAEELMTIASSGPGSMTFNAPSNKAPVILYTPLVYSGGSSVSHLDYDTYVETPEFIMIPNVLPGRTLTEIIATNTNNGVLAPLKVYGPQTIGLMNSLGYPSYDHTPAAIQIKGVSTVSLEGNDNGAAVVGMNWVLLVVLFIMLR